MKLDARRIEAFLRDPGKNRVVLIFGEDNGLVRARATELVQAVAGDLRDPFKVTELEKESWSLIPAEIASLPMGGGRRVIRVREATDAVTPWIAKALDAHGDGLVVLEAGALPARAKLRTLLERSSDAAVLPCYPQEGRALEQVIRDILTNFKINVDTEALTWFAGQLGSDRAVTQSEIEKLALYVGQGGVVDLDAARTCVGDLAGLSLDDALFAATSGDIAATDRALGLAIAEGTTPVGLLRAALLHLQRLQRARAAMEAGLSAIDATKSVRPPLFFRRESAFQLALTLWSEVALQAACQRVWEAERSCKRTGSADEVLSRSAVLGLAQRAAVQRRSRR